jgi:hypothetical protein
VAMEKMGRVAQSSFEPVVVQWDVPVAHQECVEYLRSADIVRFSGLAPLHNSTCRIHLRASQTRLLAEIGTMLRRAPFDEVKSLGSFEISGVTDVIEI